MERTMASLSPCLASFGRYSLKRTPGALVAVSLKGPPLEWPGFRSKVSIWLGPPFIHSRMHERRRWGFAAVSAARASSQPDVEQPSTPAVDSRSHSRRLKDGRRDIDGLRLVVQEEFAAVEQRPEHIRQRLLRVVAGPAAVDKLCEPLALGGGRRAG